MNIKVIVNNNKVIKAGINNNKEVLSDFNNNKNVNYKESNKEKVSNNKEVRDLSKVKINKSDKDNSIVTGDNKGGVSTVRGNKNAGKRGSY